MNSKNTKPSARADGFVLIEIHVAYGVTRIIRNEHQLATNYNSWKNSWAILAYSCGVADIHLMDFHAKRASISFQFYAVFHPFRHDATDGLLSVRLDGEIIVAVDDTVDGTAFLVLLHWR